MIKERGTKTNTKFHNYIKKNDPLSIGSRFWYKILKNA
jgi:hypothetical protein